MDSWQELEELQGRVQELEPYQQRALQLEGIEEEMVCRRYEVCLTPVVLLCNA